MFGLSWRTCQESSPMKTMISTIKHGNVYVHHLLSTRGLVRHGCFRAYSSSWHDFLGSEPMSDQFFLGLQHPLTYSLCFDRIPFLTDEQLTQPSCIVLGNSRSFLAAFAASCIELLLVMYNHSMITARYPRCRLDWVRSMNQNHV